MKRVLFGGSCLALLFVCGLSAGIGLLLLSVFFQQSQATTLNSTATVAAHAASTHFVALSAVPIPTLIPASVSTDTDVTIRIETSAPDVPNPSARPFDNVTLVLIPTTTPQPNLQTTLPQNAPPQLGTSSYPLTVTAEVMLGQTSVARYQSGVAATRTTVAAESVGIYATLTANAAGGQ